MKKAISLYLIIFDGLLAILAWSIFFYLRKRIELGNYDFRQIFHDDVLYQGLVILIVCWLFLWWLLGIYHDVRRHSRTKVLWLTFIGCLIMSLLLLLTVIRDDLTLAKVSYLYSFGLVLAVHLSIFAIGRMVFFTFWKSMMKSSRYALKGFLISPSNQAYPLPYPIMSIGRVDEIGNYNIEKHDRTHDTIIINTGEEHLLKSMIPQMIGRSNGKSILVHEDVFEKIKFDFSGIPSIRSPYVILRTSPLGPAQLNLKRCIDVIASTLAIIILSPVLLYLAMRVKMNSSGTVIFRQTRIGRYGKNFEILKFRSMYEDAEENGPQLATTNDDRCTPFGLWMRRWRLDELPQFFNVLMGDMSLVGPRPERPFYHEQLIARSPKYALLQQIRPGITSWGQIKFGYAGNLDEMLQRFRYDLLYIENMNILMDIRIIIFTILVLFQGKGR